MVTFIVFACYSPLYYDIYDLYCAGALCALHRLAVSRAATFYLLFLIYPSSLSRVQPNWDWLTWSDFLVVLLVSARPYWMCTKSRAGLALVGRHTDSSALETAALGAGCGAQRRPYFLLQGWYQVLSSCCIDLLNHKTIKLRNVPCGHERQMVSISYPAGSERTPFGMLQDLTAVLWSSVCLVVILLRRLRPTVSTRLSRISVGARVGRTRRLPAAGLRTPDAGRRDARHARRTAYLRHNMSTRITRNISKWFCCIV